MKIDERLGRLERSLGRRIERLTRRKASPREAMQIAEDVLDDVAARVEPTAGEARTFPYGRLVVTVAVPVGRRAAARAVLAHPPALGTRIHERLTAAGCAPAALPEVVVEVHEGPAPETWQGRDFEVACEPRRRKPRPEPSREAPPVKLHVLEGSAGGKRTHALHLATLRIGRTPSVSDRARRTRRVNDLAFDEEGDVNASVSRAHAHLSWSREERVFRLHDDGSTQGTRVLRAGRVLDVPGGGGRGIALQRGDVLILGRAKLRFDLP